jgi:flagellar hook-associated protein FlgK
MRLSREVLLDARPQLVSHLIGSLRIVIDARRSRSTNRIAVSGHQFVDSSHSNDVIVWKGVARAVRDVSDLMLRPSVGHQLTAFWYSTPVHTST